MHWQSVLKRMFPRVPGGPFSGQLPLWKGELVRLSYTLLGTTLPFLLSSENILHIFKTRIGTATGYIQKWGEKITDSRSMNHPF